MKKTCFISGHLDLSQEEFNNYYAEKIYKAIKENCNFVIGDARGADSYAQKLLSSYMSKEDSSLYDRVTIYHMKEKPRNNFGNFKTKGGFNDDEERDSQMTKDSTEDILWIRPPEQQKKKLGNKYNPHHISGTAKNMMRRQGF